jgi:hypothetical protein
MFTGVPVVDVGLMGREGKVARELVDVAVRATVERHLGAALHGRLAPDSAWGRVHESRTGAGAVPLRRRAPADRERHHGLAASPKLTLLASYGGSTR